MTGPRALPMLPERYINEKHSVLLPSSAQSRIMADTVGKMELATK